MAPAHAPTPTQEDIQALAAQSDSPSETLRRAAATAESALSSAETASSLRRAAATMSDPAKRSQYLQDAYAHEVQAHGQSKKARMLSSGVFQGGLGGGGIGVAVGAGLGTVVGTLVGTVAAIPIAAVGTLLGLGVGGVNGPWIRLGGKQEVGEEKKKKMKKKQKEGDEGEGKEESKEESKEAEASEEEEGILDPVALRRVADQMDEEEKKRRGSQRRAEGKEKAQEVGG